MTKDLSAARVSGLFTAYAKLSPSDRRLLFGLAALLPVGLFLRLYAAADNFWLDEIFTYFMVLGQVNSITDAITGIKVEHQPLVTLGMYLLGDQPNWLWYRLPSVIAGVGVPAMMVWAGHRRMGIATLTAMTALAVVSYPLVVYSSEARGYAPAAFFSLIAFVALDAYLRHRNQAVLPIFWLAAVIAFLYHPSSICIYLSLCLWSFLRERQNATNRLNLLREAAVCHAVPLVFTACFYFFVMRQWGSVGGDVLSLSNVIADTFAVALGFPMQAVFRWPALFAGIILLAASWWILAKTVRSDIRIFYAAALFLTPALMLAIENRPYVYVRYFVVLFPFFYLMLAQSADAAVRKFKRLRIPIAALYLLMLIGHTAATVEFLRVGRGGYLDAVQYMAENTIQPVVLVGSDHDFRNGLPIYFYRRYLPQNRDMVYLRRNQWPPEGPDWFIMHNTCSEKLIPPAALQAGERTWRLEKSYPVMGLSGVGWHLYRRGS